MDKKDSSEETTKGLVADKLKEIDGYPMAAKYNSGWDNLVQRR